MVGKDLESGVPPDAIEFMRIVFGDNFDAALSIVSGLTDLSFRLVRCALKASGGNMDHLRYMVELGNRDYRDLIMSAEYDRDRNQVASFSGEFNRDLLAYIPPKLH